MADIHKNFAVSTVLTAPSPATSGTSLVVQSGHGARFPPALTASTPSWFNATVCPAGVNPDPSNAEIVRVTNISTDTFTIARAQEGSTARSIVVGDQIYAAVTAKTLTDAETDAQSPYRTLMSAGFGFTGVAGTGTSVLLFMENASVLVAGNAGVLKVIRFLAADHAVVNKTTKLRMVAEYRTNATAPGNGPIQVGLYPVSSDAGGAGVIIETIGTKVANSSTSASPGASAQAFGDSSDFTIPADGYYAIGVIAASGQAANSLLAISAQLLVHNV